jgi:hypothetical protein
MSRGNLMFKVGLVYLVYFVNLVYFVDFVGFVYDAARKVEGEKSEKGSFLPLDCLNTGLRVRYCGQSQAQNSPLLTFLSQAIENATLFL